MHKIVPQASIGNLRILLGLNLLFINPNKFFTPPRVFTKTIVGNSIKPGGKARFATKAADVLISPQESFLRKIVGEGDVRSGELAQQASHARLMPSYQLAEG